MANLSNTIRKFNRFELKYYLTLKKAEEFGNDISKYLLTDSYGDENGNYAVTSLYYDSPQYDFYWQKKEGIKFRRKLRIRYYESQQILKDNSKVFLEIKQRLDKVTQKRRIMLTLKEAIALAQFKLAPKSLLAEDSLISQEIQSMSWQYNLQPSTVVSYFRQAFVGSDYDLGLRLTFDTNLRYRSNDLDLKSKSLGKYLFPIDMVVMEIKANDRVPYWLSELVAKHNLRLIRVSKYCQSIDLANSLFNVQSFQFS